MDARADVHRAASPARSPTASPAKLIIGTGLALQAVALAWIGARLDPDRRRTRRSIAPFVVAGVGMALFFAPVANVVLSAVRPEQEGQASGANNAIRELGGVFGVAVLAAVFAHVGGYESTQAFSDGMNTAVLVGAAVVAVGALAAFAIPGRGGRDEAKAVTPDARRESLAEAA